MTERKVKPAKLFGWWLFVPLLVGDAVIVGLPFGALGVLALGRDPHSVHTWLPGFAWAAAGVVIGWVLGGLEKQPEGK